VVGGFCGSFWVGGGAKTQFSAGRGTVGTIGGGDTEKGSRRGGKSKRGAGGGQIDVQEPGERGRRGPSERDAAISGAKGGLKELRGGFGGSR